MKIVLSVVVVVFLIGCGSDAQKKAESPRENVLKEVKEVVKTVPAKVKEDVKKIEKKVEVKTQEVVAEVAAPPKSGKEIFSACSGCHGADGSKKALGKSQAIKGWDVQKVTDALNGYKAGTYGGSMKGLMKGQASKLSDADIKAVSEYISGL